MKKFLVINTILLMCFYWHSNVEVSAEESEASISFYGEEDTNTDEVEDVNENDTNYSKGPKTGDYMEWKPVLLGGASSLIILLLIVEKRRDRHQNPDFNN